MIWIWILLAILLVFAAVLITRAVVASNNSPSRQEPTTVASTHLPIVGNVPTFSIPGIMSTGAASTSSGSTHPVLNAASNLLDPLGIFHPGGLITMFHH
jgi:hypothetical protein